MRLATVLWRSEEGSERCALERAGDGLRLRGTAVVAEEGVPVEVRYAVGVDAEWRTREVELTVDTAEDREELLLAANGAGAWSSTGRPLRQVEGCIDVDLGFSPSTNTIPIRRLGLAEGEVAEIEVAWVRFPQLTVERSAQSYERLGPTRYRFRSGSFVADLVVDDEGLVLDYPGGWQATARI